MNIELKAPANQFRVVAVDTFDGTPWLEGDFDDIDDAKHRAFHVGGVMCKTHVYDDQGKHIYDAGTF